MTDAPPPVSRRYRLTPAGLAALRASAHRHRPWEFSTGPRTPDGKAAAGQNALRHGERSAATRDALRDARALMRIVRDA